MTVEQDMRGYFKRRYPVLPAFDSPTTQAATVIDPPTTASASLDVQCSASASAYGELAALGALDIQASARASAYGELAAAGVVDVQVSGILTGATGDMTASGTLDTTASADLTAYGDMTASGALDTVAAADLTPTVEAGDMVATGTLDVQSSADLSAYGQMAASASLDTTASADLTAYGEMTASGALDTTSSADLSAYGQMTATGTLDVTSSADLTASGPSITVWYAKPTATGAGDGTSWADADTLGDALASASDGEQVWAVAGTYSLKLTPNPGVTIYGGFNAASPQGSTGARDLENDITTVDGGSSDSCIEAYMSSSGAGDWVFSDGVHYANGSEPDFSDYPNQGGVFTLEGITANAVKVTFRNGSAIDNEGPLAACFCVIQNSGGPSAGEQVIRLENFIVAGGTGDIQAGAFHTDTELQVINCNVIDADNAAFEVLAAEDNGHVMVRNSNVRILNDAGDAFYLVDGGTVDCQYSNVSGGYTGTGNINSDPDWNDQPNGDWTLAGTSPCIDAGDGDEAPDTDMWLQARYDDGGTGAGTPDYTDIGPLEYQGP